jgi:hypothetical protein
LKYTAKKIERKATDWKKIFLNIHVLKDLYPKYIKNFYNSRLPTGQNIRIKEIWIHIHIGNDL